MVVGVRKMQWVDIVRWVEHSAWGEGGWEWDSISGVRTPHHGCIVLATREMIMKHLISTYLTYNKCKIFIWYYESFTAITVMLCGHQLISNRKQNFLHTHFDWFIFINEWISFFIIWQVVFTGLKLTPKSWGHTKQQWQSWNFEYYPGCISDSQNRCGPFPKIFWKILLTILIWELHPNHTYNYIYLRIAYIRQWQITLED